MSVRYARLLALLLSLACLPFVGGPVRAQSASANLYTGEVPVPDQSDEQRAIALKSALAQVVVKLTGDRTAVSGETVAKLVESAERYVQQYTYRQEVANVDGQPLLRLSLVASFDRAALDRVLRDRGLRVWTPAGRAPVVTWLALDEGSGPRLLDNTDPAGRAMQQVAEQRGITLVWPRVDTPDQALTTAQIVWEGDIMTLSADAARYQTDTVLVGQLRRVGDVWSARWTLALGGQAQPTWESRDADLSTALGSRGRTPHHHRKDLGQRPAVGAGLCAAERDPRRKRTRTRIPARAGPRRRRAAQGHVESRAGPLAGLPAARRCAARDQYRTAGRGGRSDAGTESLGRSGSGRLPSPHCHLLRRRTQLAARAGPLRRPGAIRNHRAIGFSRVPHNACATFLTY
jgi:hypothetical protein